VERTDLITAIVVGGIEFTSDGSFSRICETAERGSHGGGLKLLLSNTIAFKTAHQIGIY
jgi:hypothetical protein